MPERQALVHPRDELLAAMDRIYRQRMTTTSGGNLSIREPSGDIWITPARIDKGSLRREDIVCVRADGKIEGLHRPSSEFPFHQAIYAARPEIRGIVHAHPVALVAFSITRQVPDLRIFHQASHVCGGAALAPYALPGSAALGQNIAGVFAQGIDCALLENHGVVVGGGSLQQAFERFEALEFAARTILVARRLGELRTLSEAQLDQARRRKVSLTPGPQPPATSPEKELRRQLCEFVRRGCRQGLLISTEGSFSARVGDDAFLITPSQRDRFTLTPEDIVAVRGDTYAEGHMPSRAVAVHRAIYRRHAGVGAIAFAHPVHATAFSVTGVTLDARTIPESYIFLRDVQQLPHGLLYQDGTEFAARVSLKQPAAILENDGVVSLGRDVLDAFDRLEVLETTAEAIVSSRSLGEIVPLAGSVADELNAAFGL